jgi:hypothetical protein
LANMVPAPLRGAPSPPDFYAADLRPSFRVSGGAIGASAGMFHSRCSFQAVLIVRGRFFVRTSDARCRELSERSPDKRSDIRVKPLNSEPAYRCAHAGYLLLLFDGNATLADADLDASGLLPRLVNLIAQYDSDNGECANDEIENIAIHCPGFPFLGSMPDGRSIRKNIVHRASRSVAPDITIRRKMSRVLDLAQQQDRMSVATDGSLRVPYGIRLEDKASVARMSAATSGSSL